MATECVLKKTINGILQAMDEEGAWSTDEKLIIVQQFTQFYEMYKTIIQEYSLSEQPEFQTVIDLLFYLNTEYSTFTSTPIQYEVCSATYNNTLESIRNGTSDTLVPETIVHFVAVEAFSRLKWYTLILKEV